MEDIRKDYEEERYRRSKDRILWSTINRPNGVNRMGNRTHKDSLDEKDIQRFRRSMLGYS